MTDECAGPILPHEGLWLTLPELGVFETAEVRLTLGIVVPWWERVRIWCGLRRPFVAECGLWRDGREVERWTHPIPAFGTRAARHAIASEVIREAIACRAEDWRVSVAFVR